MTLDQLVNLGGVIRVFGSADDNEALDAVYMQIDTSGTGTVDVNGNFARNNADLSGYTVEEFGTDTPEDTSDDWWGIPVNGKESWNLSINNKNNSGYEFQNKTVVIRVRAVDNHGLAGDWSSSVKILIDSEAPTIGSDQPLQLVQYANNDGTGEVVAVQDYKDGISIKGKWYLTGSAWDDSGIKTITVSETTETGVITPNDYTVKNGNVWEAFSETSKPNDGEAPVTIFRIPIDTEGKGSGTLRFTITVKDQGSDGGKETSRNIVVLYDNLAPEFKSELKDNKNNDIGNENFIEQSNKSFLIKGTVSDETNGSGFYRIAIFFIRDAFTNGSSSLPKRLYNPVGEVSENKVEYHSYETHIGSNGVSFELDGNGKGLPVYSVTVSRDKEDEITLPAATTEQEQNIRKNICKGGLVKIGGVYRLITGVTGNKVTFTPSVEKEQTTAILVCLRAASQ